VSSWQNIHLMAWQVFGASVRGASHARHELPNQDAIGWQPESGGGAVGLLAVADGHGSAKSFRSDRGAQLAVATALTTLQAFLAQPADPQHFTRLKRLAEEQFPREVARRWRAAVQEDVARAPFAETERALLNGQDAALAYGATLLCALATPDYAIYWQLGDGDILVVSDAGEVDRPLPRDDRLFANETTSLCGKDAWREMRCRFQPHGDAPPALVMLATDGYANSFRDDASFAQVAADVWQMMTADGLAAVQAQLPDWLQEASAAGSGDDITVGFIWRSAC